LQRCFRTLAFRDLFGGDVDADDFTGCIAQRMPIGDPRTFVGLIGALTRNFDADHRFARLHDRADDAFNGIGQRRYAVPHRAAKMVLDRDAAYLGEALIDLQIAAVG